MSFLTSYSTPIQALCRNFHVKTLFVFGSATTDQFSKESDVDLLVDFEDLSPLDYADNYFNLKFQLQDLLKRQVDLLENKSLNNPYLKSQIDRTKVSVYGK
jgi:predicted nucleotidyltransferase